jgi:glutamate N-acetyltransferase/amino-acid N-acetyltransferase
MVGHARPSGHVSAIPVHILTSRSSSYGTFMSYQLPRGFRCAGLHCGIKSDPQREDLALFVSDLACVAAGVYTRNLIFAAPVGFDRARTPGDAIRAVVVNSGNANACTGERGDADVAEMARCVQEACDLEPDSALVLSTGIIGSFLPMEQIRSGIRAAAGRLNRDAEGLEAAARGMLTTDTVTKLAQRTLNIEGVEVQITGVAKGAAMIGPNMATMLGVVFTDAALEPDDAQQMLRSVVDQSFNCISVEGHMSTNDTVLLLSNGAAGGPVPRGSSLEAFQESLSDACQELARAIPSDGEGATHLITLHVRGCASAEAARQIAKTVADSALVKTAIAGADPNWGRIISAAGYANVPFDPQGVRLWINTHAMYERGSPLPFDAAQVSASISGARETVIELVFSEGQHDTRFWTTDLTAEYVRLNADYHT